MSVARVLLLMIVYPGYVICGLGGGLVIYRVRRIPELLTTAQELKDTGIIMMTVPILDLLKGQSRLAAVDWHSWLFAIGVFLVMCGILLSVIWERRRSRGKKSHPSRKKDDEG